MPRKAIFVKAYFRIGKRNVFSPHRADTFSVTCELLFAAFWPFNAMPEQQCLSRFGKIL